MLLVKVLFLCGVALAIGMMLSNRDITSNLQVAPTTSPTPSSQVDCIINGIKTTAASQEICDQWKDFSPITPTPAHVPVQKQAYIDPDPIIDCGSEFVSCKGSFIRVKMSQCQFVTCCGFNDGSWKLYPSLDQCKKDQQAGISAKQGSTVSNDIFSICMKTQDMKVESCKQACKNQLDLDKSTCELAFVGQNAALGQSPDNYGVCLNGTDGAADEYTKCSNSCLDQLEQDLKQCNK